MNKLWWLCIALLFSAPLLAQEFEVPEDYRLEEEDDYAKYEKEVIQCVDWLLKTPLQEEGVKRQEANEFLMKWLTGSPYVTLEINVDILTFMETTPQLLIVFMGGWAKHVLETKQFEDMLAGNLAGLEASMAFYTANQEILGKDKNVEKYLKMKEKGTLKDYVAKRI